jgi:tRNA dimethylallyltransferase
MAVQRPVIALIGPTAAGKSAVALRLAAELGAEILSVDSMQVYRGMDIGTAKPTPPQQERIRHHLVDVVDPDSDFTVAKFVERADAVIADAASRDVSLIATGGTPLYFKALFEGLFDGPGADLSIRTRLNTQPLNELHVQLSRVDPAAADRIHINDRKRLVRALEVWELTGRPISSFQTAWHSGTARHAACWFGLLWEKDELNRRINARVRQMIDAGWIDETRGLLQKFGTLSKTAAQATGYFELIEHIQGRISLNDAIEQIKIATRQLARRQMKWFRRFRNVQWLGGNESAEALTRRILQSTRGGIE